MPIKKVYDKILRVILAEICPRCRMPTSAGYCQACRLDFPLVSKPCLRCGLTRPVDRCPARDAEWVLDAVRAPFQYSAPVDRHVHALKYHGRRTLGRALGLTLAGSLRSVDDVEALVPVPMHAARMRQRGFNQADEIAVTVARVLGLPLLISGIGRSRATPPQAELGPADRHANMRGAFNVRRRLDGVRLAIVDDVMTTGATMNSLAAELKAAGSSHVQGWAVARTSAPAHKLCSLRPEQEVEQNTCVYGSA